MLQSKAEGVENHDAWQLATVILCTLRVHAGSHAHLEQH